MRKLIIHQHLSPGDIIPLTAAVRDLHKAYPGQFLTDLQTTARDDIWANNPYVCKLDPNASDVETVKADYDLIHHSNGAAYGFIHGFHQDFEKKLGLTIPVTSNKGDLYLSDQERNSMPVSPRPYWIVDAGHKMDYTAKHWGFWNYQEVVKLCPSVQFVQIGMIGQNHNHRKLDGANVIDMRGKTSIRQLILLVHFSAGVISPISFPFHLGYSTPVNPRWGRRTRPVICLMGGREPHEWLGTAPSAQLMHTNGLIDCDDFGGCWKSRTVDLHDGDWKSKPDSLCRHPVQCGDETIPYCMSLIRPEYVAYLVQVANSSLESMARAN